MLAMLAALLSSTSAARKIEVHEQVKTVSRTEAALCMWNGAFDRETDC